MRLAFGRCIVFSTSSDKEEEARHFGASQFVDTSQPAILEKYANTCDFILSTVTAGLSWSNYINVLKPDGKLCIVGVPDADIQVSALQLILGQKSVISSVVGSRSEMQAMLEFSARHYIIPQIETYPIHEINTVLERLKKNEVRYRAVLEIG